MASNYEFDKGTEAAHTAAKKMGEGVSQAADTARQNGADAMKQGQDAMRHGGEQAMKQGQDAMKQGQAALAQVADRTRETMDRGVKAFEQFNDQARGSVDAFTASSRAAAQGVEQMVQQAAEFSRKTFEGATAAMRVLATAKTPNEVFQAQNDFAKAQFDNFVGEYSKLTENMLRLTGEVFQPITSRMTETAAKASETVRTTIAGTNR